MTLIGRAACAVWLANLIVGPVCADDSGFASGFYIGAEGMLLNKSVQQELKVTAEQAEKLAPLIVGFTRRLFDENTTNRDLPPEEIGKKFWQLHESLAPELHKDVANILRPEQVTRFAEIQVQQLGSVLFTKPHLQELLKLTDEQKSKLVAIHNDSVRAVNAVTMSPRKTDEARGDVLKKTAELRKRADEQARAVLTDAQKMRLNQLMGKPFELKPGFSVP